jgi:hypothetical protein
MADEMLDKYDTVRNGVWSFEEFKHWLKANPKVFQYFSGTFSKELWSVKR